MANITWKSLSTAWKPEPSNKNYFNTNKENTKKGKKEKEKTKKQKNKKKKKKQKQHRGGFAPPSIRIEKFHN
jgi:hypothetical protein